MGSKCKRTWKKPQLKDLLLRDVVTLKCTYISMREKMVRGTLKGTAVSLSKLNYHEKVFGDFKDEKNMHLVFYLLKHFCHVTDIMGIWCDKVFDS